MKLTEKAADQIKKVIEAQNLPLGTYVRVGIKGHSCSGPVYSFSLDEEHDPTYDDIIEQHGLQVVSSKQFSELLEHVEVDFYSSEEKAGFTFKNTNPLQVLSGGGGCGGGGCGSGGCGH